MSDPISAVTATTTLLDADLFALAKFTGTGPTGFASRHITAANLLSEVASDTTFITNLATNTAFVTQLVEDTTLVNEVLTDTDFITNQQSVLRTVVEDVAGVAYTLVLADGRHKYKRSTSGSDVTITIPAQASVAWPDNTYIELEQGGAGALTIAAGVGVTLNVNANLSAVLNGRYAVAGLKRTALNAWTLFGNLVPT